MTKLSRGWRTPMRGTAAVIGAVGLVLMSAGLSLVVQGSASADTPKVHKSYVCKYVGKPGQAERLQTGQNPIWVDNDSLPGAVKGALAYVGEVFADAHGKSVVIVANTPRLNPEPTLADCTGVVTPSVQFNDSACVNGSPSSPSWVGTDTADITYSVTSGNVADGSSATVTAMPKTGFAFSADADNVFTHTFGPAASNCADGPPTPTLVTPGVSFDDSGCAQGVATSPSWTGSDTADIVYAVTAGAVADGSAVTITATPKPGFAFAPDTTSTFSHTFGPTAICGDAGSALVTPGVSFVDSACVGGESTTPSWTGSDAADIVYEVSSGAVADGSAVTVSATPKPGFAFAPSATSTFSHTFGPAAANCAGAHATAVTSTAALFKNPACPTDEVAVNLGGSGFLSPAQWEAKGDALDAQGITYTITGAFAPGGTVEVAATADAGFVLTPGSASRWTHTFKGTLSCSAGTPLVVPSAIEAGLETTGTSAEASSAVHVWGYSLTSIGAVLFMGAVVMRRRVSPR